MDEKVGTGRDRKSPRFPPASRRLTLTIPGKSVAARPLGNNACSCTSDFSYGIWSSIHLTRIVSRTILSLSLLFTALFLYHFAFIVIVFALHRQPVDSFKKHREGEVSWEKIVGEHERFLRHHERATLLVATTYGIGRRFAS